MNTLMHTIAPRMKPEGREELAGTSLEKRSAHCRTCGGITHDQWDYERHEFINVN
jgi:hypothetical protein